MKVEVTEKRPDYFKERWPGQFRVFSHLEYATGIPHPLFVITTHKENGLPNANYSTWGSFYGDVGGFYAVFPMWHNMHTYANILRDREFCINFLAVAYEEGCQKTIQNNSMDGDEIAAGGFTAEPSRMIKPPRIKESFMCLECELVSATDLSGQGVSSLMVGRVRLVAAEEDFAHGFDAKYTDSGFMYLIHTPKDLSTGDIQGEGIATLKIAKNR